MKLIMENWRKFIAEEDAPEPDDEGGAVAKAGKVAGKIGAWIAKAWKGLDDYSREDYCTRKFPLYLKNAQDIRTFGDLHTLLKCTTEYKDRKKVLSIISRSVPWVGMAREAFEQASDSAGFILQMYQTPDGERPPGNIGKLDMDDDVAAIVDDKVENAFVRFLVRALESEGNMEREIPASWDITDQLRDYLAQHKNSRTIKGYKEED